MLSKTLSPGGSVYIQPTARWMRNSSGNDGIKRGTLSAAISKKAIVAGSHGSKIACPYDARSAYDSHVPFAKSSKGGRGRVCARFWRTWAKWDACKYLLRSSNVSGRRVGTGRPAYLGEKMVAS